MTVMLMLLDGQIPSSSDRLSNKNLEEFTSPYLEYIDIRLLATRIPKSEPN